MKLFKTCHSGLMRSTKICNFTSPKFSSGQTFVLSKSIEFSNTGEALRSENLDSMLSLTAIIALR